MLIELVKEKTFFPEFGGNLKLPESERIKVHYRFVTPGERRKFRYFEPLEFDTKGREASKRRRYIEDRAGLIQTVVFKIENLSVKVGDGKKVDIENGDMLYSYPIPQGLISEIELEVANGSDPEVPTLPLG